MPGSGTAILLADVRVGNGGARYAGDGPRFTTVSPNTDGLRDAAVVHFRLGGTARVYLQVSQVARASRRRGSSPRPRVLLTAGPHALRWEPRTTAAPRTYMLRLIARDRSGRREVYGTLSPGDPSAHVVRVLGVDAGFTRPSYAPGARAQLVVSTDEPSLTLQLFRAGASSCTAGGWSAGRRGGSSAGPRRR